MTKNRFFASLLVFTLMFCFLSSGIIEAKSNEWYSDTGEGNEWYDADVETMHRTGIMFGYGGKFRPDNPLTRAEAATIILRLFGISADENAENPFDDVSQDKWYCPFVCTAMKNDLMLGTGKSRFSPESSITREEYCTILFRVAEKADIGVSTGSDLAFSDNDRISDWALDGVKFCFENGIINGFPDGSFRPGKEATRAQIASLNSRFLKMFMRIEYSGGGEGSCPMFLLFRSLDYVLYNLKSMDQETLYFIASFEDRTDTKYYRSEKEKQNGVFNEFRNRILNDEKIIIPLIDGKELPFNENRNDNVAIHLFDACERPWISFSNDLVEIRLTYLDDEIAEEANEKGCSWLKEKLEPGSRNTYNYLEYREKYIAEGWGQLATITVTEETVMFDGKETKALVSSYLNGTLDREVVTVWVVSGNTLAAVGGFPEDVWDVISRMTIGSHEFE